MITSHHKAEFERQGYVVVRGVFTPGEAAQLREHFMALRAAGSYPGDFAASVPKEGDSLERYPRMIHMHRWDSVTREWLIDARLRDCLTGLLGAEPSAVQSMLYFKPPKSRGQSLHQDNLYLQASPGTCVAAWMALDPCDEENGCMQAVPGSHRWPLLCSQEADSEQSFTDVETPLPPDAKAEPILMKVGDVLFFGGALVHGSYPNTSADRFRCALIGHYVEGEVEVVSRFVQPVLRMDGTEAYLTASEGGAPCGVWTDKDGHPEIEMVSHLAKPTRTE